jgi:CCR4-NOT transcription complex subunit 6
VVSHARCAGYRGVYRPKTRIRTVEQWERARVDGCAVFWRTSRFNFLTENWIEFSNTTVQRAAEFPDQEALSRLLSRDNVALNVLLEMIPAGRQRRHLFVSNSHIHWNPSFSDVKLMQAQLLMDECEQFVSRSGGRIPMIIAGDFNSMPSSGVYAYIRDGRLRPDHPEFLGYRYGQYSGPGALGLRHNFRLASAYAATGAEPAFTNYTGDFVGTLDYMWYSHESVAVSAVVQMIDTATARKRVALPNAHHPSDHVSLIADFVLK